MMDSEPFGFTVRTRTDAEGQLWWNVFLPHQCDGWDIAGDDWGGASHADAVRDLTRFITEAQAALALLIAERETDPDRGE